MAPRRQIFTLPNQDREAVTLSDQFTQGPVVLAFMPGAFSGTCTKEMCTFRDSIAEFNKVSATVLGVTRRHVLRLEGVGRRTIVAVHAAERLQQGRDSPVGVFNADMIGLKDIAKRAAFVIDRAGVVRHREVLDDARNEPNYAKVPSALAASMSSSLVVFVLEIFGTEWRDLFSDPP